MTAYTTQGNAIFVGSKIVVPASQEDDTWDAEMITEVEDILDNGIVVFSDEYYDLHEIELERVQLYQG